MSLLICLLACVCRLTRVLCGLTGVPGRCVVRIFLLAGKEHKSPVVIESVTLPCLKILQVVMQPPAAAGTAAGAAQPAPSTSTAPSRVDRGGSDWSDFLVGRVCSVL